MAFFSNIGNFSNRSTMKLVVEVTTQEVAGGTQATIVNYMRRDDNLEPYRFDAPRSYNVPGGRISSTSGDLYQTPRAGDVTTFSYDFRGQPAGTVFYVWGGASGFNRFFRYDYGTSSSVTISVTGGSNIGSASVTVPITLFQQATTYTLSYNSNGGSPTPSSQTLTGGASFTAAAAPTRSGFTFVRWQGSNGTNYVPGFSYTMPSSNLTLTAQWATNRTVTYNSNGGSPTPSTQTVGAGLNFNAAAAPTRSGFNFNHWDGSNGLIYTPFVSYTMPDQNITLTASWSAIVPPPSAPTNLSVTNVTSNSLRLNWSITTDTTQYRAYLNGVSQGTTTSTFFNYSGLSPVTSYTLGVRAEGQGGDSSIVTTTGTTVQATFTTPNVVGALRDAATTTLLNAGFGAVTVTLTTSGATSVNNRRVITQSPASGTTATAGTTATIDVYNFLLTMPNILGLERVPAETTLQNAGFSLFSSSLSTAGATVQNNKTVRSQNPTGGSLANPADPVVFTIFNFLTTVPNVVGQTLSNAITTLTASGFINVTTTLDEDGATEQNVNTVKSQSPVSSSTTYNPKDQNVSLVVYSLGITGKRRSDTGFTPLTTARRFSGTEWVPLTVQKRFDGTNWVDITS